MVSGAGAAPPGVNLKARMPQPSTECPVDDQGPLQSLFVSAGCTLQKEPAEHVGVKSKLEKP